LSIERGSSLSYVAWVNYCLIESFGSLSVSLFWSFVAMSTPRESSKRGYPVIVIGGQVGSCLGPAIDMTSEKLGLPNLLLFAGTLVLLVVAYLFVYMFFVERNLLRFTREKTTIAVTTDNAVTLDANQKPTDGLWVGFVLLLTSPYLLGVFCISTIYEVIGIIMDQQMKLIAGEQYAGNTEGYTSFLGLFGMLTNIVSLVTSLLLTSSLLRKLGVPITLLIFPSLVTVLCVVILGFPQLMVVFVAQLILKAASYAVNNPCKEVLYTVTNPDVKMKVKQWIDVVGGRSAKALGALICDPFKNDVAGMLTYGTLSSLAFVAFWMMSAFYVGSAFTERSKKQDEEIDRAKDEERIETEVMIRDTIGCEETPDGGEYDTPSCMNTQLEEEQIDLQKGYVNSLVGEDDELN